MNKNMMTMMAALLLSSSAIAAPVSTSDARQKALSFLQKQAPAAARGHRAASEMPQLTEAEAFGDALHVFNIGQDNGFVIVSGDDRTAEILGYVDGGSFDLRNIPDNMRFWLQMYADQIQALGTAQVRKAIPETVRPEVKPTVTTQWDQPDPFNNYILDDYPEQAQYYGNNLMTGCVATSMAQAVYRAAKNYKEKHGEWPAIPTHKVPSYTISQSGTTSDGWTLPELPEYQFDWANMREDNYSSLLYSDITDKQIKAVGKLMQYCGRAMKMEYDKVNSASVFVWAGARMYDCLNLSKFVQSVDRAYFTSEDWEDMMYKEVSEGRAVCYSANVGPETSSEGHAFILDGYKDGLWHINWGWGKSVTDFGGHPKADGYFSLSVMQPMAAGSGSASVLEAQYKYLQQAIINISYEDPADAVEALNFYWNGKNVYTSSIGGWGAYNVLGATTIYEEGWAVRHADGTISDNIWYKDNHANYTLTEYTSIGVHTGTTFYLSERILPTEDGEYDIVHISRPKGSDTWHASYGTDKNYVTITISGGKITKAIAHPIDVSKDQLALTGLEFVGDMEASKDNTVQVTINNTGDDFFGTLAMYYSTGTSLESTKKYDQLATIKPGQTTHEFTVNLPKGEYNLWFIANPSSYPYASNAFATGKMFIGYGADANKVQEGDLSFDGQEGAATLSVASVNGQLAPVTGSFVVTNNAASTYKNTYYLAVEKGTTTYATATADAEVGANSTKTIAFDLGTVTGLASGQTYTIRLYKKSGDAEVNVATTSLTLKPYFRYWLADGTVKEFAETGYSNKLSGDGLQAVAIDCRGISKNATMYMDGVTNPNCIFYIEESQKPTSSSYSTYGRNLVIDGVAELIKLNGDNDFYVPETFEAKEINLTRTFSNNAWNTISLPFDVNSVKNGTKTLKWFSSKDDQRCHFWLMQLIDADNESLKFTYAPYFQAGKPYIIAVPGSSTEWGDDWNLVGKEITFRGLNVTVPATQAGSETFNGVTFQSTTTKQTVSGYVLNGTQFVPDNAAVVNPFSAYLIKSDASRPMRLLLPGSDATGIFSVSTDEADPSVYDLQGRRVTLPRRGLYIQNGRKVVK